MGLLFQMIGTQLFASFGALVPVAFAALLSVVPVPAISQDHPEIYRAFDSNRLSHQDKTFLQAGLALEGYYDGLLDGEWGPNSQGSFERFTRSNFESPPLDWHMAMLVFPYVEWAQNGGWGYQYLDDLGVSLLVPSESFIQEQPEGIFANFRHRDGTLAYSVAKTGWNDVQGLHNFTANWHERDAPPFVVRSDHLLVTSAAKRNGSILYARSDLVRGSWSTVMLSAAERDGKILGIVSSSISVGRRDQLGPTSEDTWIRPSARFLRCCGTTMGTSPTLTMMSGATRAVQVQASSFPALVTSSPMPMS
ncbi:MAG: hypothetical protein R3D59_04125 [Paracoccaceae bacterium]